MAVPEHREASFPKAGRRKEVVNLQVLQTAYRKPGSASHRAAAPADAVRDSLLIEPELRAFEVCLVHEAFPGTGPQNKSEGRGRSLRTAMRVHNACNTPQHTFDLCRNVLPGVTFRIRRDGLRIPPSL